MSKWIPALVIGDDEIGREALKRRLRLHGFEAHLAEDGPTGLEIVNEIGPAFVLHRLDDAGNGWIGGVG